MSRRYRWTWQDYALFTFERLSLVGLTVLLAAIVWQAWVTW